LGCELAHGRRQAAHGGSDFLGGEDGALSEGHGARFKVSNNVFKINVTFVTRRRLSDYAIKGDIRLNLQNQPETGITTNSLVL
jgi:hypothetical protein